MGVYTFVCRSSGGKWTAKQHGEGDLEASADSTHDLQSNLVKTVLSSESGGVQTAFSIITPSSAVFQVIVGGGSGGGFVSGGAAAPSGGAGAAAEAPPAEEKKEEKEESDDDMGFSLFD